MYTQKTTRNWGMFFAGICVAIAGLVMLFFPGMGIFTAAIVFGIFLIGIGIVNLLSYAFYHRRLGTSGWAVAKGIVDIGVGVLFLFAPFLTMAALGIVTGLYLICYGVFQLIAAYGMRSVVTGTGWIAFSGICAIIAGIVLFAGPYLFALFLAFYLLARGIAMIALGLSTGSAHTDLTNTQYPYGV